MHASDPPPTRPRTYPLWTIVLIVVAIVLHLNYWLWDHDAIVLGLPVNFLYHVLLTLLLSAVMLVLVRKAWPPFLDDGDRE